MDNNKRVSSANPSIGTKKSAVEKTWTTPPRPLVPAPDHPRLYTIRSEDVSHLAVFVGSKRPYLEDPGFVIWDEQKASELIRGTLQPGDICVYNEYPSMCWRWGVAVNVSSWTDEDGERDVQIHMSGTADYVLSWPLKSDIMVYRIDETGILQDCSDGYFLRPFELAVTAGKLDRDSYVTPGDKMSEKIDRARRTTLQDSLVADGLADRC